MDVYYPTDEDLERIKSWEIKKREDVVALLEFVRSIWHYADVGGFDEIGTSSGKLEAHTFGWNGNEELVGALQDNFSFWALCWRIHRRGGHYEFEIPETL